MSESPQARLGISYATAKQAQEALKLLHDVLGYSYAKIAEEPPWCDIPLGTISDIKRTGKVPRKWRSVLGLKSRPRVAIHKEDMTSAANTIMNNLSDENVRTLTTILTARLQRGAVDFSDE